MIATIRGVLLREIGRLRDEIEGFRSDADLWRAIPGTANAAGTLALHLCGNLQHFIGATLGATGYRRDRDAEFSRRDVTRAELLAEIDRARTAVDETLASLDADATGFYPVAFLDERRTTAWVLLHLLGHLDYHLGQINYARRYVGAESEGRR